MTGVQPATRKSAKQRQEHRAGTDAGGMDIDMVRTVGGGGITDHQDSTLHLAQGHLTV